MHDAFLLFAGQLVVRAEEVRHHHAAEFFAEFFRRDAPGAAWRDAIECECFGDESPEPVVSPADAPAGFVHVDGGAAANGFADRCHFGRQPVGDTLSGKRQRASAHAQAAEVFEHAPFSQTAHQGTA